MAYAPFVIQGVVVPTFDSTASANYYYYIKKTGEAVADGTSFSTATANINFNTYTFPYKVVGAALFLNHTAGGTPPNYTIGWRSWVYDATNGLSRIANGVSSAITATTNVTVMAGGVGLMPCSGNLGIGFSINTTAAAGASQTVIIGYSLLCV